MNKPAAADVHVKALKPEGAVGDMKVEHGKAANDESDAAPAVLPKATKAAPAPVAMKALNAMNKNRIT